MRTNTSHEQVVRANEGPGRYADGRGGWYVKVTLGRDPFTGQRRQITRRGFRTAAEAAKGRRELLGQVDTGLLKACPNSMTVGELLDLYLDGLDADDLLSPKTRFDYRTATNLCDLHWAGGRCGT